MRIGLIGARRTGNHFIANWIISNFIGADYFAEEPGKNPHHPEEYLGWRHYHNIIANMDKMPLMSNLVKATDTEHGVYGIENVGLTIARPGHRIYSRGQRDSDPNAFLDVQVVILRDPINSIASVLKNRERVSPVNKIIRLFVEYADEFLEPKIKKYIFVKYEGICYDKQYRDQKAAEIGFVNQDIGLDTVSGAGGGSSFDARKHDGDAASMTVGDRWRHYADDPEYKWLLTYPRLLELRERIYGPLPKGLSL